MICTCSRCGLEHRRSPAKIKGRKNLFCSRECSQSFIVETRSIKSKSSCSICNSTLTPNEKRYEKSKTPARNPVCTWCKITNKNKKWLPINVFLKKIEKIIGITKKCKWCGKESRNNYCSKQCFHKCLHRNCMEDPKRHLNMVFRISMGQCLKGEKKRRRTFDLAGYSVDDLKKHIEKQFLPGMTWENFGKLWHIDHIVPLRAFNFTKPEDPDFKRAWAICNLRPLWAKENISKGGRLERPFQPTLAEK